MNNWGRVQASFPALEWGVFILLVTLPLLLMTIKFPSWCFLCRLSVHSFSECREIKSLFCPWIWYKGFSNFSHFFSTALMFQEWKSWMLELIVNSKVWLERTILCSILPTHWWQCDKYTCFVECQQWGVIWNFELLLSINLKFMKDGFVPKWWWWWWWW